MLFLSIILYVSVSVCGQQLGRVPLAQVSVSNPGERGLIPAQPFFPPTITSHHSSQPLLALPASTPSPEHESAHLNEVDGGVVVLDHGYRAAAPGTSRPLPPVVLNALTKIRRERTEPPDLVIFVDEFEENKHGRLMDAQDIPGKFRKPHEVTKQLDSNFSPKRRVRLLRRPPTQSVLLPHRKSHLKTGTQIPVVLDTDNLQSTGRPNVPQQSFFQTLNDDEGLQDIPARNFRQKFRRVNDRALERSDSHTRRDHTTRGPNHSVDSFPPSFANNLPLADPQSSVSRHEPPRNSRPPSENFDTRFDSQTETHEEDPRNFPHETDQIPLLPPSDFLHPLVSTTVEPLLRQQTPLPPPTFSVFSFHNRQRAIDNQKSSRNPNSFTESQPSLPQTSTLPFNPFSPLHNPNTPLKPIPDTEGKLGNSQAFPTQFPTSKGRPQQQDSSQFLYRPGPQPTNLQSTPSQITERPTGYLPVQSTEIPDQITRRPLSYLPSAPTDRTDQLPKRPKSYLPILPSVNPDLQTRRPKGYLPAEPTQGSDQATERPTYLPSQPIASSSQPILELPLPDTKHIPKHNQDINNQQFHQTTEQRPLLRQPENSGFDEEGDAEQSRNGQNNKNRKEDDYYYYDDEYYYYEYDDYDLHNDERRVPSSSQKAATTTTTTPRPHRKPATAPPAYYRRLAKRPRVTNAPSGNRATQLKRPQHLRELTEAEREGLVSDLIQLTPPSVVTLPTTIQEPQNSFLNREVPHEIQLYSTPTKQPLVPNLELSLPEETQDGENEAPFVPDLELSLPRETEDEDETHIHPPFQNPNIHSGVPIQQLTPPELNVDEDFEPDVPTSTGVGYVPARHIPSHTIELGTFLGDGRGLSVRVPSEDFLLYHFSQAQRSDREKNEPVYFEPRDASYEDIEETEDIETLEYDSEGERELSTSLTLPEPDHREFKRHVDNLEYSLHSLNDNIESKASVSSRKNINTYNDDRIDNKNNEQISPQNIKQGSLTTNNDKQRTGNMNNEQISPQNIRHGTFNVNNDEQIDKNTEQINRQYIRPGTLNTNNDERIDNKNTEQISRQSIKQGTLNINHDEQRTGDMNNEQISLQNIRQGTTYNGNNDEQVNNKNTEQIYRQYITQGTLKVNNDEEIDDTNTEQISRQYKRQDLNTNHDERIYKNNEHISSATVDTIKNEKRYVVFPPHTIGAPRIEFRKIKSDQQRETSAERRKNTNQHIHNSNDSPIRKIIDSPIITRTDSSIITTDSPITTGTNQPISKSPDSPAITKTDSPIITKTGLPITESSDSTTTKLMNERLSITAIPPRRTRYLERSQNRRERHISLIDMVTRDETDNDTRQTLIRSIQPETEAEKRATTMNGRFLRLPLIGLTGKQALHSKTIPTTVRSRVKPTQRSLAPNSTLTNPTHKPLPKAQKTSFQNSYDRDSLPSNSKDISLPISSIASYIPNTASERSPLPDFKTLLNERESERIVKLEGWNRDLPYPHVNIPTPSPALSGLPFYIRGQRDLGPFILASV